MDNSISDSSFFETVLNKELNVLFWDDEAEGRYKNLFTEIELGFEKYGWHACILTGMKETIQLALTGKYDAVVLDLLLGNKKPVGLEMLKELRQKRAFLPIIIFTVAPEMKYVESAMRGDVSYYLTKPVRSYHDVIRAIEVGIEREKAKERLVQDRYYATVGKLAAGVAHFIKNSLWNITSRAQMLLEEVEEKGEAHKLLETIKRRGDEANKVVINLLNFARREVGKHEKKKLKIEAIIVNALEMVDQELNAYNIDKKIKMPKEDIEIFGDEFELKEAFLNLMKNSIEAMPDGGQLSIDVGLRNKMVVICISDSGVGMNEETLEKLFIPFYTTKADSVGFGLFETQRIIQKHEGKIKVNSKLGEGSTFIIEFPPITD